MPKTLDTHQTRPQPSLQTNNSGGSHDQFPAGGEPFPKDFLWGAATASYQIEGHPLADGVDLRGYMIWTLMDNFEWAAGFRVRCGLAYTDYATQRRTWKDSATWYRHVIERNRVMPLAAPV